jgi:parvulin-like peptidyl-prolyl isomerase
MKQTVIRGLFFILVGFGAGACQKHAEGPSVATVGSHNITEEELRTRLSDAPAAYRQYAASPEGRRQFLNLIIREKVLLAEAHKLGIPKEQAYKQAVAKYKEDAAERLQDYQNTLQVESALRRLRSTELAASDTDVERYYNDNSAEYQKPVEITASHILLSNEQDALVAMARLKAKEPFERVAKQMSKDPGTAVRGGKLAPFRRGMLVPEFEEAVFALKVGATSGIVKSQFGFHIIKKLSEKALPAQPLTQVKVTSISSGTAP